VDSDLDLTWTCDLCTWTCRLGLDDFRIRGLGLGLDTMGLDYIHGVSTCLLRLHDYISGGIALINVPEK